MDNTDSRNLQQLSGAILLFCWLTVTMLLWWFALYQAPASSPDWLQRARLVCFGTDGSGLPDSSGWIMLTLGPLSFLIAIFVAMGSDLRHALSTLSHQMAGKIAILVILISCLFEARWVYGRIENGLAIANAEYTAIDDGELPSDYPHTSHEAPLFLLTDQHGAEVSLSSFPGKTIVLTFAFAHCQTVCPALVASTRAAIASLPMETTELLVVTLDPWRDTPKALPSLAQRWQLPENAHVLSGTIPEVNSVIEQYKVANTRDEKTGDITHPALVFVIAPDSTIAYTFNNPPAKWLQQAIARTKSTSRKVTNG